MNFANAYRKIIETQQFLQSENAIPKTFQSYDDVFCNIFLEQSKKDKYHYSYILLMSILSEADHEKKLPFERYSPYNNNDLKSEEQILPKILNYQNLVTTMKTLRKQRSLFLNLIDIITFNLIPSLFLMFLEENSFDSFIDFIMNLYTNEDDLDFQILLSRSIFVSPIFLQFIRNVFYPIFSSFSDDAIFIDNMEFQSQTIENIRNKILQSFQLNIQSCPNYIVKFLKSLKNTTNLTSIEILKKCIFDPIISNPFLFLISDAWLSDFKDKKENISFILKSALTEDLIERIYSIFENNNLYFNAFLNKKQFNNDYLAIKYHKVIDCIDVLAINQIQSILDGVNPKKNIIDTIYSNCFSEYSLYSSHFEGETDPWICIRHVLIESPKLPEEIDFESETIDFSELLKIIEHNLNRINSRSRKIQSKILFNRAHSIFSKKNQTKFADNEFIEKVESMKMLKSEEGIPNETELEELYEKLNIVPIQTNMAVDELFELFFTFLTNGIQPEGVEIPFRIHKMVENQLETIHQFEGYLNECIQKVKPIVFYYNCRGIFYHRFWRNLQFHDYLAMRTDLRKYDEICYDTFSKSLTKFVNSFLSMGEEAVPKSAKYLLKNISKYEQEFIQIRRIFESNSDPLAKFTQFEKTVNFIIGDMTIFFHKKSLEADEIYCLKEICLAFANPPYFISNVVYFNEYLNYVHRPSSFKNARHFLMLVFNFVVKQVNRIVAHRYSLPVYAISLNHTKHLNVYVTGDDSSLIATAYKSCLVLFKPDIRITDMTELVDGIEQNRIPEKFRLGPNFSTVYFCVVFVVNLVFVKNLKPKNICPKDEPNRIVSNYAVFASSCSNYNFERPEVKFIRLPNIDLKIIAYKKDSNTSVLNNLSNGHDVEFELFNDLFHRLHLSITDNV